MSFSRIALLLAFGLSVVAAVAADHRDAYLEDARIACERKDAIACAKHRALSYLDAVAAGQVSSARAFNSMFSPLSAAGVRLVKVPSEGAEDAPFELFDDVEQRSDDSEVAKLWKFGLRQVERFARKYAVAVAVPETNAGLVPRVISEDDVNAIESGESRGKKKKLQLLLPLLILFKFFKLKVLLIPILLGVLAIKKILLLAAVFLPSIVGLLKFCKQQPFYHEYSAPAAYDYGVTSYAAGGGASSASTYGKDLYARRNYEAQNMAYRAQTQAQAQQQ
ncbi:uncharacterized protein LOC132192612 [Neocloeon triangulifer]|uniref:uncharacterized protein LOC132192612 n=1 Tax=Neocloeon triangulifer TaxID=2078957 RepID=UPI00286EFBA8|nr:uncharacterized protein LOC132192612 [Neocloeon triangulifer]